MSTENFDNSATESVSATENTNITAENTNTTTAASTNTNASDWRSSLSDEYKNLESLQKYTDINAVVKTLINQEKLIGKKQAGLVGEQGRTTYEPDAYKYEVKDPNLAVQPKILDAVSAKAAELQIDPKQYQTLVDAYLEKEVEYAAELEQAKAQELEAAKSNLQKEWGSNFQDRLNNANKAFELFADDGLKETISTLPAAARVSITKLMENIYSKIGETSFGKGQNSDLTSGNALTKIEEMRLDPNSAYNQGDPAAKQEMARLYSIAYPNKG